MGGGLGKFQKRAKCNEISKQILNRKPRTYLQKLIATCQTLRTNSVYWQIYGLVALAVASSVRKLRHWKNKPSWAQF